MRPKVAVVILLGLLLLVIILQNTQVVAVRVLFWEIQMSRLLLIVLAAAVGFIGGYVVASLRAGRNGRTTPGVTAGSGPLN
ncbi:MAG TPA: LapA family protein [Candidatus Polarisedimenticolia bacterium]|nr:LapA family protein [Candidatus Polarisedimenticolia bacterium]